MSEKMELLKPRNFSEVINDTLAFIKINIRSLGQVILWLVLPIILVGGYFFSDYFQSILNMMGHRDVMAGNHGLPFSISSLGLGYLGILGASFCQHLAIMQLFLKYEKSETGVVEASDIFQGMRNSALQFLGFIFGLGILYIGAVMITMLVMVGLITAFRSTVISFIVVLLVIALVVGIIYLVISISLSPISYLRENNGIFNSLSRSAFLIKGHWWQTFGVLLVASFIAQFGSMIFIIPFYVLFFMQAMHSVSSTMASFDIGIWGRISAMFMLCGTTIISSLVTVALIMQYYSLVEQKDGETLYKQIEQIGNPETPGV